MSINFNEDMGPEARGMIEKMFDTVAIDNRTALLGSMEKAFEATKMKAIANAAKQVAVLEINKIGDRKDVGGIIYELDENGWKKLPIGTRL